MAERQDSDGTPNGEDALSEEATTHGFKSHPAGARWLKNRVKGGKIRRSEKEGQYRFETG